MVLASNKWLSNSGDDQKPSEVLTSSNSAIVKANTAETDLLEENLMSAKQADGSSCSGSEEELRTIAEAATPVSELALTVMVDNANQNEEVPMTSVDQRHELKERQRSFDNILQAMANNSNMGYVINDSFSFRDDLETSRTTIPSEGMGPSVEQDNNNHTYRAALINASFNNMMIDGIDSDATDTNINMLNSELSMKSSNSTIEMSPSAIDDNMGALGGVSNKGDRSSFLNTLTVGGNMTNVNTSQTIVMNNANAMSSNKPVNPVYALDANRSSVLNPGSNNASNKNTHIINGDAISTTTNGQAKIVLYCEQSSHPFQTRTILLTPHIECKVGRLIAKCKASESNAIFDCKVLSRNHAVLWYSDDGKFYVKDTKSSNGTFINDNKLGTEAAELHFGDIVKFGVDVLENSRKEVHGCIIASVKLYLPDGRQAVSIDSNSQRLQYSGESRISFDDLHRLNVYMQETSQREKALKSKLYNIQNLLDATRKNSSTCWQAMISEDQLLHRIHSLEKKIQILEKKMPESALKSEIMKLLDDKIAYQHSAKEALRSVYLERCEVMHKMTKMESDFSMSENECKILQDQVTCTEEALHDITERMRLLETEYNEERTETERRQTEAKIEFEKRVKELNEKLQQREEECESLRVRIAELMQQQKTTNTGRADSHGDDEKLQKLAIENLDAVIAGMDIGDDDDDDDGDEGDEDESAEVQEKNQFSKPGNVYDFNGSSGGSGNDKQDGLNLESSAAQKFTGGEATIMKWLKNSDLNRKDGSMDIINAICNNESDSSDEQESISPNAVAVCNKEIKQRCSKLEKKLENLHGHIKQLEGEVKDSLMPFDEGSLVKSEKYEDVKSEPEKSDNQKSGDKYSAKLIETINLLNEAFEDILNNFVDLQSTIVQSQKNCHEDPAGETVGFSTTTATKFQKIDTITKPFTNKSLPEIDELCEHDSEDDEDNDSANNKKQFVSQSTVVTEEINDTEAIKAAFQVQIEELKIKLKDQENDSQHTLDMLQTECETYKKKVTELLKITEALSQDSLKLSTNSDEVSGDGLSSDSGVSSVDKTSEKAIQISNTSANTMTTGSLSDVENNSNGSGAFEKQMIEELAAMNSLAVQREEELIAYKESLEQSQKENLKLRKDLLQMQKDPRNISNLPLMCKVASMGVAVIGVIAYLIITYF